MSKVILDLYEQVSSNLNNNNLQIPNWDYPNSDESEIADLNSNLDIDGRVGDIGEWNTLEDVTERLLNSNNLDERPTQKDKHLIEGALRHKGFEALAFYKSFRSKDEKPFKGKWGIFYLSDGLSYVASEINTYFPTWKKPRELALNFLHSHEFYHFQADLNSLHLENLLGKKLYDPIRRSLRGYQSHFVEEAIANRMSYQFAKKTKIEEFAKDFMDVQPGAYRRYDEPLEQLVAEWLAVTIDFSSPWQRLRRDDLTPWFMQSPKKYSKKSICPQYVVYVSHLSSYFPLALRMPIVKSVVETVSFNKSINKLYTVKKKWDNTKTKLCNNSLSHGLNFKPWGGGLWSVKIDYGVRAHLRKLEDGIWEAVKIGNHGLMGHG